MKSKNDMTMVAKEIDFSGTVCVQVNSKVVTESYGYANFPEKRKNEANTRFGIASGAKFFTSIAICQLVEQKKLSFHSKITECLDMDFPFFDKEITIHHLLTHTSGIPDYFDESIMDDFEELWVKVPMYHIRRLKDFLPLFQHEQMKELPGSEFRYNNSGYILLGLIIEQATGMHFNDYVEKYILAASDMVDSGYFELDALPERTATGYIENEDGSWRTNVFSIPAKGGSDGGIFVTAPEMIKLWNTLLTGKLLSREMQDQLLTQRIEVEEDIHYGYCGYMEVTNKRVRKFILMGYDPGVNFRMTYHPDDDRMIAVCSNKSDGAYEMLKAAEKAFI